MIHTRTLIQTLSQCSEASLVGGKAANLGRLIRAGFRVPDGFVITTEAFISARDRFTEDIAEEIRAAYRELGSGPVAVRSSATAEDLGSASMAGQYETFLDIVGEDSLLEVVQRCWASLDSPRTRAYLREHSIDLSCVKMAVVVQKLIAADVSGVLFTENPGASKEMLLEASWGLGESIVSGRVQPDVLRLDRKTQRVISATISDKKVYIAAGSHPYSPSPGTPGEGRGEGYSLNIENRSISQQNPHPNPLPEYRERGMGESNPQLHWQPVEESRRLKPCLNGRDVYHLWQLGNHAADHFGAPQDIEWAIEAGEVYILQSRPITTHRESLAFEQTITSIQSHLRAELSAGRGPWVLHNLAETLPHPTQLTWSVIRRFMSGSGGFGIMHRQAGFEPSPEVDKEGFLDLIGGRIYMDVSRAPEIHFENFPFAYDINDLKKNPQASQAAPTLPRGSAFARLGMQRKLTAVNAKLKEISQKLDQKLRNELFQDVSAYTTNNKTLDLRTLTTDWLIELWQEHEQIVLNTFAPHLFMPSLICGMAMEELKSFIRENFWNENAESLAQLISSGGRPDVSITASSQLYEVGQGTRPLETWLAEHGHRAAPGEFELASPRWREKPEAARRLAPAEDPLERHRRVAEQVARRVEVLRSRLAHADQLEFDRRIDLLRRYVVFREDGKNSLMLGYDLLRDLAMEIGRRLEIGDDVFFLTREELFDALKVGFAPYHLIEERKLTHDAERRLSLPRVIDSAAIDSLGQSVPLANGNHGHKAFAISAGQARGIARIVESPDQAGDLGENYILVCPSTDPSWTPLFVNAAGLVLECGGTLSHGAVVAREMGLPAVVLPDATRLFQDGQEISVDARHGWVGLASTKPNQAVLDIDSDDVHLPDEMIPPPVGRKDRRAGMIRNGFAAFWTIFLFGFFLLPQTWLRQPVISLLDTLLWPIVRLLGKPATVAIVAALIAVTTLLIQKFLVDNRRLLECKRRAAVLKKQAETLPANSRRRSVMLGLASTVPLRTLMAAMVPVGILLGPMVMPFIWFHERMDPTVWNAPIGSAVRIVALVDSDWNQPVKIDVSGRVDVDSTTPASRTLPPIRQTLERLLTLYHQPADKPSGPWQLQMVPDASREQTATDLQAYLKTGIPPQAIAWLIRPHADLNGQIPVNISTAGHALTVHAVLGDNSPPKQSSVLGEKGSPINEVKIFYQKPKAEQFFWRPFARLADHSRIPFSASLAAIDVSWLWLYILAYLPVLMLLRAVLKIA